MTDSKTSSISQDATAIFAGGCFWCLEPAFAQLAGVKKLTVGFTGGSVPNPSYQQVAHGNTGHIESIQVIYDPAQLSYQQLLDTFWRQIDPTDSGGQFADRGDTYQTAIFYNSEEQKKLAEKSKEKMEKSGIFPAPIVTKILAAKEFYPADESHQQYYKKNPIGYNLYAWGSGRKAYLKNTWKDQANENNSG